jgi:hypothetical protein
MGPAFKTIQLEMGSSSGSGETSPIFGAIIRRLQRLVQTIEQGNWLEKMCIWGGTICRRLRNFHSKKSGIDAQIQ